MEQTSIALPHALEPRGEVDRWSSNRIEILIVPLISIGIVALLHLLPRLDPKLPAMLQQSDRMYAALRIIRVTLAAFFDAIFLAQLAAAFGYNIPSGSVMTGCILLLLAIIGNYIPNLRPNYFIGIRTPWTLESPVTWRATHRLGGRLIFFGALILLVLDFFLSQSVVAFFLVTFAVLLTVWAFLYSWHHFRTHGARRETT
jgi:uncharacterized membrane protein